MVFDSCVAFKGCQHRGPAENATIQQAVLFLTGLQLPLATFTAWSLAGLNAVIGFQDCMSPTFFLVFGFCFASSILGFSNTH